MAQKVKVKWVGGPGLEEYHGFDGEDAHERPIPLDLVKGQEASVSPEKAAQFKSDFGHLCVVDGKGPDKNGSPDKVESIDALAERIENVSDEELAEFGKDSRKGVQKLLAAEIARRDAVAAEAAASDDPAANGA